MKNTLIVRLIILFITLCPLRLMADTQNRLTLTPDVSLEVSQKQGLAAAYGGVIGENAVLMGGANFPDVPVAEGGQKHFYTTIWQLSDAQWKKAGDLKEALAGGGSAMVNDAIALVGGSNQQGLVKTGYQLTLQDGKIVCESLPDLPVALAEHALVSQGDVLYAVGGKCSNDNSTVEPNMTIYCLDVKTDKAWRELTTMPGRSRLQCVATVQNGNTAACLYVFGGYTMGEDSVRVLTDGLCLNLKTLQWSTTAPMPDGLTVTGGTCATSGYSHILCMGGVNKEVFETRCNDQHPDSTYFLHEPAWYRFNSKALVYHTITNSWYVMAESDLLARAGANLVAMPDGSWLYINGESKPGWRSTDVTRITLEHEVSFGWLNWIVLVVYLLGMLGLGYYFMRRESGADDFFKGGGRIPWWAAGISIYATMLSAITYMSIPAKAYATNWTYYPMLVTILLVSFPVIKYYLPYFRRLNITSAYEYLEIRFNLATRLLASGLFIVFMVARMALVLYLPSLALTAVTGINIQLCIVLMGIVTIIYCTMGGVEAVVWGDVVQGIILVGGAIFAAVFLILNTEGGVDGYLQIAADNDKMRLFEWSWDYRSVTFWVAIVGGIANNLISYTSDQTVIQRYLTTKDEKSAGRSIMMNGLMCVFISVVFYVIGTGLYTFFQTHPAELDVTMQKGDAIFPYFMMSQMPAGVAGLLIAAVFAATMSTISSNINSVSTAFSVDFYRRLRPETSDKKMLSVARKTCVFSGIIGVVIALMMASWDILSLLDYFNTILGLLTGGLGGLFLMGIFIKRIKGQAALIGFICGTIFVFWLQFCTDANLFLFGAAGMAVSTLVAWLLSWNSLFK